MMHLKKKESKLIYNAERKMGSHLYITSRKKNFQHIIRFNLIYIYIA